jgi:hypothetical protein
MDNADLDTYQLDLLMVVSWEILYPLKQKPKHPSSNTVQQLAEGGMLKDLVISQVQSAEGSAGTLINEESTEMALESTFPRRAVQIDAVIELEESPLVWYQHSLNVKGCVPKHHCKKPKVKGSGNTGAIYHAWCHDSGLLPIELQADMELVSFSTQMVVQYFDTIIYRGNDTIDTDACKIHS